VQRGRREIGSCRSFLVKRKKEAGKRGSFGCQEGHPQEPRDVWKALGEREETG
jgi:hypothetical protein